MILFLNHLCFSTVAYTLNNCSFFRLYLKYLRALAEKTDLGRLAGPSLLRLVDDALNLNLRMSSEIWDYLEQTIEVIKYGFKLLCFNG